MDENLARLEQLFPDSKYVLISKYDEFAWKDREYDSSLDTKSPLNKWRTSPLNYDRAQDAVDRGFRIGWVVPEGYCVVDIDNGTHPQDQEKVEELLNYFEVKYSYNYTSRGIHLLFKEPSLKIKSDSRTKCALNILIDTRANDSGYIILPSNDPHRKWGVWIEESEDLPYFLKPLLKDATPSFIGMAEGDGRNNALFKWRSKLDATQKLTDEEVSKSIRLINQRLFNVPMSNNELVATVLRHRAESKTKAEDEEDKTNRFNKIAEDIIEKYDIISYFDNFYKFDGIYYKPIFDIDIEKLIHNEINKNINHAQRREIIEFLKVKTQVEIDDFDKYWNKIACRNGIINLVSGELEPANKYEINTICIPWTYNKDADYSPVIDQFMKELCDGDIIKVQFLYQIAGYCLLKKNIFEKFVICKGEGGTGKSTYMNLLQLLVGGDENTAHVGLAQMDKDYYLSTLHRKLLNIDDDVVDSRTLENTGRFKSVVSGNMISCRQIYKDILCFKAYCTCIFSCNKLPRILDDTTGLYRRMILIELNHKIENPDPLFINKLTDKDMEYFFMKAVDGIMTAIEEGRFRITQSESELMELFKRRQSPLNEWIFDMDIRLVDVHEHECLPLYKEFASWCETNGYQKIMAMFSFRESICNLYQVELDRRINVETNTSRMYFIRRGVIDLDFKPF